MLLIIFDEWRERIMKCVFFGKKRVYNGGKGQRGSF